MKYVMRIGKAEYIMAAKLMKPAKSRLMTVRFANAVLAIVFTAAAIMLLTGENNISYAEGIAAILFGLSAACVCLIIRSFRKLDENNAKADVTPLQVTYRFDDSALTGSSVNHTFTLYWKDLKRWGDSEGYIYMIFAKKQVVVLNKKQLKEKESSEIIAYMKKLSPTIQEKNLNQVA